MVDVNDFLDDVVPAIASLVYRQPQHHNRFRQDEIIIFWVSSAGWFPLPDAVKEAFGLPPICPSYLVSLSLEQRWASTGCVKWSCGLSWAIEIVTSTVRIQSLRKLRYSDPPDTGPCDFSRLRRHHV